MQQRKIVRLDLASFKKPSIDGNPTLPLRALWYLINTVIFRSSLLGLMPSPSKTAVLRMFGAKVGNGVVIKPRVNIKSPWFLEIGDHVWIGEQVWIDNHTTVRIGPNTCISQGVYLFTGNHDWNDPAFAFFCTPIEIGESVWITAFCQIPPGSAIPDQTVVLDKE
ncbi:LbetaH domain-containing protein [Marivita geojedonensis]|uniref:hypothetical protein n=1 Tax=Marivita geojedonensis TaxID=1123756 RepID=UPI000A1F8EA1|nr:hypothetical protein [Marivita geojedonensis]PRY81490.1 putative colanic acid biosynthesis acetyltransferase WcaF [Marivita geojedonensis]